MSFKNTENSKAFTKVKIKLDMYMGTGSDVQLYNFFKTHPSYRKMLDVELKEPKKVLNTEMETITLKTVVHWLFGIRKQYFDGYLKIISLDKKGGMELMIPNHSPDEVKAFIKILETDHNIAYQGNS